MLTVHIEKHGDFYEAYRVDAKHINKALPDTVICRNRGMECVVIPAHALETHVASLNAKGISVKINAKIN